MAVMRKQAGSLLLNRPNNPLGQRPYLLDIQRLIFLRMIPANPWRGGVLNGIVSVPCRYIHSPFRTCRLADFDHTWRLLAGFCRAAPGV
jgi:hypothetical protein